MNSSPEISLFRKGAASSLTGLVPLLLMLICSWPVVAQTSTATLLGTVQDATQAGIPRAAIRLVNVDSGTENDSVTDRQGDFLLAGIIPGNYQLDIERDGFATTEVIGLSLSAGDRREIIIRMKVGAVTETVHVAASTAILNSADATVSTTVDRNLVSAIPLSGRTLQDLIDLIPGIVTQSPQAATETQTGTQGEISVNGELTDANAFYVDGISANLNPGTSSGQSRLASTGSIAGLTAVGTTQSLVPVDALEEVRVLTSTYSAEYGRTPGGQFTFETRSGTSQVHGSLFNYLRSNVLDAQDWFATSRYPYISYDPAIYYQNDFGATLGGPVVVPHLYSGRDRSFVFLSYEGLYLDQPTPQTFSYTPNICAPDPPCGDIPAMVPILDAFPGTFGNYGVGNPSSGLAEAVVNGVSLPSHVNSGSVRIDHNVSPKESLFFRVEGTSSIGRSNQLYSVTENHADTDTVNAGATSRLAGTRTNELRLGFARSYGSANTITEELGTTGGISYVKPTGALNVGLGIPALSGATSANAYIHIVGVGDSDAETNQSSSSLQQWNFRDTLSVERGGHLIKAGFDERYLPLAIHPPSLSVLADFFDDNSIQNGTPTDLVITRSATANPAMNEFSAFAEDSWHASKSLNLSFGLRWDVNPAPHGRSSGDAYVARGDVADTASLHLEPRGTPLWQTSWLDLAPRFGAAWVLDNNPGRELVMRAGGGLFYDTGTQPALDAFRGLGFSASQHFLSSPIPATATQLDFTTAVAAPYTTASVFDFPQHLSSPYSWQWNVGVEQALGRTQSLTVAWVGADGRRLLQEQRRDVSSSNPNFGDVFYFPIGLTSNYQSLQTKYQHSLAHGVQALASWTWAHALNYGSTDPAFPLVYGNSDLDVRHNLEAAASWDSSTPKDRFLSRRRLLEGWSADARLIARTGFPVNIAGNFFFDPLTGEPYYSGVNRIPDRPLYLHNSEYPGGRMFNGGQDAANPAFVLPSGSREGDATRNLMRGFDAVQANLAIRQTFRVGDGIDLRFEGETFNIFNHPNFGYIDPYLSDLLFGQASKMLNQSFGAPGALYDQGGPRSIQVSVRLAF